MSERVTVLKSLFHSFPLSLLIFLRIEAEEADSVVEQDVALLIKGEVIGVFDHADGCFKELRPDHELC